MVCVVVTTRVGTFVGHVSGQVDDWQLDEDELVARELVRDGNELEVVTLLIIILDELMDGVLVEEETEPETEELLIGILDELAAKELVAGALDAEVSSELGTVGLLTDEDGLTNDEIWLEVANILVDIDAILLMLDDGDKSDEKLAVEARAGDADVPAAEEKLELSEEDGVEALL
ncbi:hypothetical protein L207DRAFT_589222 [Hyaloscypha variabilis F]|uniref:Uncharacterized protein n=1 Tax=Hyaloscypha variabilis (strain UAMH 11265 / GT02V1 / F) TaxID=1149755 RepID=A0A2J6R599_HYAVF|nr:hypothetical protein L207DRAFT_589222 [Hyaloscypha variabilis F]